jgi:polyphosphate kinase 2 (PPK2 family)
VHHFLQPEGAGQLAAFYQKRVQTQAPEGGAAVAFDPSQISRLDAENAVARIKNETKIKALEELKHHEEKTANRSKVIRAIGQRMGEIRAKRRLQKMLTETEYYGRIFSQ